MSEVTIPLIKPITAHGAEVSELTLREPTGDDVERCGYPLAIDGSSVIPQAASVSKLIARLAGIPPSSVKQLSMPDYNAAMGVVLGFFGGTDGQANP
jgi:hypothetical protein